MQHGAFAMGRVNLLAGLKLNLANLQHMLRPLVEQLHNLRIELVDGFAVFGDVHRGKRITSGSRWNEAVRENPQSLLPENLRVDPAAPSPARDQRSAAIPVS